MVKRFGICYIQICEDHVDTLMAVQILQQFCEVKQKYGLLHKQSQCNHMNTHNAITVVQSLNNTMFRPNLRGPLEGPTEMCYKGTILQRKCRKITMLQFYKEILCKIPW